MRYSIARQSRKGSRSANQDRVGCAEAPGRILLAVADGLGGHPGGDVAATTAVETMVAFFEEVTDELIREPAAFLVLALAEAHRRINEQAAGDGDDAPGTTAVVCLVQNGYACWAHVGDSRLYHVRDGLLLARTLDDTTSERMRLDGVISEEEMRSPLWQGHLLQCLGGVRRPQVHVTSEVPLETGDLLVLSTDGLWRGLSTAELAAAFGGTDIARALDTLMARVERAMRGDCDNLSAAVLRWDDAPPSTPPLASGDALEIDQAALWDKATRARRSAAAHRSPAAEAAGAEGIGADTDAPGQGDVATGDAGVATRERPSTAAPRRPPESTTRRGKRGNDRPGAPAKDDMDAAIEELEGFVRKLERWL
jgi:PPM family protein phosphatase